MAPMTDPADTDGAYDEDEEREEGDPWPPPVRRPGPGARCRRGVHPRRGAPAGRGPNERACRSRRHRATSASGHLKLRWSDTARRRMSECPADHVPLCSGLTRGADRTWRPSTAFGHRTSARPIRRYGGTSAPGARPAEGVALVIGDPDRARRRHDQRFGAHAPVRVRHDQVGVLGGRFVHAHRGAVDE